MARSRTLTAWLAGLCLSGTAPAQTVSTSSAPSAVSVTVYRAPDRGTDEPMRLAWLDGYALISETRTVTIPAGEADIRFEGVAGGILPHTAIVSGLPGGVSEKNQDAYLLSPASLLDRSLGARLRLRRTSRATGAVREEEAVVRTGADGGVVLQTAAGYEALRCSGLPEALVYDRVPAGLSARPTLSVRTRSTGRTSATVTLSYLATGFDWQANYVGTLSPDGTAMELFAWVTLANGDETSFVRASTQTVAGRPNKARDARDYGEDMRLALRCWPGGTTTSDLRRLEESEEIVVTGSRLTRREFGEPPPPPPPAPMEMAVPVSVVTQEELGDLKLYRVPEPVTVAARSQKQVALLARPRVAVRQVYRRIIAFNPDTSVVPATRVFLTRNRVQEGLGLPLPAGPVALFVRSGGRPVLVGEGALGDRAVGEDVEIEAGLAAGVTSRITPEVGGGFVLDVSNDRATGVRFEADFQQEVTATGSTLVRRNGRDMWSVNVPANGRVTLRYRAGR